MTIGIPGSFACASGSAANQARMCSRSTPVPQWLASPSRAINTLIQGARQLERGV